MSMTGKLRLGLALVAGLGLAACGSEKNETLEVFKTLPAMIKGNSGKPATAGITPQAVANVLSSTGAPVELFHFEGRKAQFMMIQIERNGAYRSYGSAARQGVVMRDGMITATRGLGGDLMHSEEDALLAQVQRRAPGSVTYQQRFLTPEDVTETKTYTCDLTPGVQQAVALGEINSSGTIMRAVCVGDGIKFENMYVVESSGQILGGRQWLGVNIGYVSNQGLRR